MVWLLAVLVLALPALIGASPALAQDVLPPFGAEEEEQILGRNEFVQPAWMAVISDGQGTRILVGSGDPVFLERDPRPIGVIRNVGADGLTLDRTDGRRVVRVIRGCLLPGTKDLVLRETVLVKSLEYRHRVLVRGERKRLDGELYLVGIQGTRAILQRDVGPPPSATELMERRLEAIRIVQTSPRVWEVNASDVQTAMESGEAIISRTLANSRVGLSGDFGVSLEVKTPIVGGRFYKDGFLITTPNLASRAGLQVGDRILEVNDMPIDGIGALVRAYRQVKNNSSLRTVTLRIERNAQPLTLRYRIR